VWAASIAGDTYRPLGAISRRLRAHRAEPSRNAETPLRPAGTLLDRDKHRSTAGSEVVRPGDAQSVSSPLPSAGASHGNSRCRSFGRQLRWSRTKRIRPGDRRSGRATASDARSIPGRVSVASNITSWLDKERARKRERPNAEANHLPDSPTPHSSAFVDCVRIAIARFP